MRTSSGGSLWDISSELEVVPGRDAAVGGGTRLPRTRRRHWLRVAAPPPSPAPPLPSAVRLGVRHRQRRGEGRAMARHIRRRLLGEQLVHSSPMSWVSSWPASVLLCSSARTAVPILPGHGAGTRREVTTPPRQKTRSPTPLRVVDGLLPGDLLLDKDPVPSFLLEPLPPPLAADNDWCRTGAGLSP
jgi:hypothetical protein